LRDTQNEKQRLAKSLQELQQTIKNPAQLAGQALPQHGKYTEKLKALQAKNQLLQQRLNVLETAEDLNISNQEVKFAELNRDLESKQKEAKFAQEQLVKISQQIQAQKEAITTCNRDLQSCNKNSAQHDQAQAVAVTLKNSLKSLESKYDKLQEKHQQCQEVIKGLRGQVRLINKKKTESEEKFKYKIEDLKKINQAQYENQIESIKTKCKTLEAALDRLKQENTVLKNDLEQAEPLEEEFSLKLDKDIVAQQRSQQEQLKLQQKIKNLEELLKQSQSSIVTKEEELVRLRPREQEFTETKKRLENTIETLIQEKEEEVENLRVEFKEQCRDAQETRFKEFQAQLEAKNRENVELQQAREQCGDKLQQTQQQLLEQTRQHAQQREQMISELEACRRSCEKLKSEINDLKSEIDAKNAELKSLEEQLQQAQTTSQTELTQSRQQHKAEKKALENEHKSQLEENKKTFESFESSLKQQKVELLAKNEEIKQLKEAQQKLASALENKEQELQRLRREVGENKKKLATVDQTIVENNTEITRLKESIQPLKTELQKITENRNTLTATLDALKRNKKDVNRYKKLNTKLLNEREELETKITALEAEATKVKAERDELKSFKDGKDQITQDQINKNEILSQQNKSISTPNYNLISTNRDLQQKITELEEQRKKLTENLTEKIQELQTKTTELLEQQKRFTSFATDTVEDKQWKIRDDFSATDFKIGEFFTLPGNDLDTTQTFVPSKLKKKYEHYNDIKEIQSVAFSPDGTKLAYTDTPTGGVGGNLQLWGFQNEEGKNQPTKLGDVTPRSNVAFAKHTDLTSNTTEDSIITSGDNADDPYIRFWGTTPTTRQQRRNSAQKVYQNFAWKLPKYQGETRQNHIKSMAYSSDGKVIVVGDSGGSLHAFFITNRHQRRQSPKIEQIFSEPKISDPLPIETVAISKIQTDSSFKYRVAAAANELSRNGNSKWKIAIFLVSFGKLNRFYSEKYFFDISSKPTSLAFSSDGALLAVATTSEVSIYKIDVSNNQLLHNLETNKTHTVAFLSSRDQNDQKEQKQQKQPEALVLFSETECQLWYYNSKTQTSNVVGITNNEQASPNSPITAGAVSQDGKHIAIAFKPLYQQTGNDRSSQTSIQAKSLLQVYSRP